MATFLPLKYETISDVADNAPVVVLLPGVGCGIEFWDPVLPALKSAFHIITFANPGVDGCPNARVFTVTDLALAVIDTLRNYGVSRCHVVGHSMGGFVAQKIATLRPDLVDRLVLLSSSFGGRATDADIQSVLAHMLPIWPTQRKLVKDNPHEAFRFAVGRHTPERYPAAYAAFVANRTNPPVAEEVYAAHFFCAIKFSGLSHVANIRQPTLVVHGSDDNIINIRGGRELASRLPNARFLEVDCGHITPFEVPDLGQTMRKFLTGKAVGERLPALPPLSAEDLAADDAWRRKRLGNLSMTALFALSKGLPAGIKHLLGTLRASV
jgi:pimeloyl-ACP methyl ester carboxylesterase